MIRAETFLETAKKHGFALYTGVPCSYLKPFINYVIDADDLDYVGAANEGDAVAIAAGAEMAGVRSVVMFQNSGLGNTVSPLSSLNAIFRIPVMVITTLRGEPGGPHDEPQHELMGAITEKQLELLKVRWEYFPTEEQDVPFALERASAYMQSERLPFAFVMRKDSVKDHKLATKPKGHPLPTAQPDLPDFPAERPTRTDALRAIQSVVRPNHVVVATTGFTGRELYALDDRENQLYMVGSMGCAASFGLGIARAQPHRRVVVIDGDGAALMRLSAMATLGFERPDNLVHVLLDNEMHESTGGQSTVTHSVDLSLAAHACGYPTVRRPSSVHNLAELIAAARGLTFLHVKTRGGVPENLPRPKITPVAVAERFRKVLAS